MADPQNHETGAETPHDLHIGRILNELLDRRARGELIDEAEVRANHPELAEELLDHFRVLSDLKRPDDPIEQMVAQAVLEKPSDSQQIARLGQYGIVGFIGRGGMGVVLKASEDSLNRTVALKLLRPELAHDERALRRFTQEAKAAGGLQHPNIVTVHAIGEARGTHFIAMEYVRGMNLADLIREQGPLDPETIRHVFRQILSGLAAAHEAGLIHRDIKSSNILIQEGVSQRAGDGGGETATPPQSSPRGPEMTGRVKIADFGLARVVTAQTRMTMPDSVLGTPEYMSPEQARGEEDIDHRADLYSAGVVLYEMLTGRTPFKAEKPSAVIHRILHEDPPDPRGISAEVDPSLASLSLRLMAKRPQHRVDSANEAIVALGAGGRVTSPERRRRLGRRVLLVAAAIGLALGGFWLAAHVGPPADVGSNQSAIARVWSDPEGDYPTQIWADYADGRTRQVFYRFGKEAAAVREVALVDLDGNGSADHVVAGLKRPINGKSLFLLTVERQTVWSLGLAPEAEINWPDLDGPPVAWAFRTVAAVDVDGSPGDELIVGGARIIEYPRRISVIDPREGVIRSTFWHTGDLKEILIINDFPYAEDDPSPAIIAVGVNNKLDGFGGDPPPQPYVRLPGEDRPRTVHRQVPVVIVLDPRNMDGLGPPRSPRIDLPPVTPWAYGFLDMPTIILQEESPGVFHEEPNAGLRSPRRWFAAKQGHTTPLLEVSVIDLSESEDPKQWATIVFTRDLEVSGVIPGRVHAPPPGTGGWEELWHPIIQRGEYVGD